MAKIFYFTDCIDGNARKRQKLRLGSLLPNYDVKFFKLNKKNRIPTLTGAVDMMDAVRLGKERNLFVFNHAPRTNTKYKNGEPFYFAYLGPSIIIGTISSFCMLKHLGVLGEVFFLPINEVCSKYVEYDDEVERIYSSQFRSYEYIPYLAKFLVEGKYGDKQNSELEDCITQEQVWFVDCFGNIKTTIPGCRVLDVKNGTPVTFGELTFPFYKNFSEVPVGSTAFILGSSGYGTLEKNRFVEIVNNGDNAAVELNLKKGSFIV